MGAQVSLSPSNWSMLYRSCCSSVISRILLATTRTALRWVYWIQCMIKMWFQVTFQFRFHTRIVYKIIHWNHCIYLFEINRAKWWYIFLHFIQNSIGYGNKLSMSTEFILIEENGHFYWVYNCSHSWCLIPSPNSTVKIFPVSTQGT